MAGVLDPVNESDDLLDAYTAVSTTADHLAKALEMSLASGRTVALMALWERFHGSVLAPLHLYVERPAVFGRLGIHPSPVVGPTTRAELEWLQLPLYNAADAREARRPIRLSPGAARKDRIRTDWEDVVVRQNGTMPRALPASSFQAVAHVTSTGALRLMPRPFVGRHLRLRSKRDVVKDLLRVLARPRVNAAVMQALEDCDCAFVDVQRIRARRTVEVAASLLGRFRDKPSVVIASAPSDLFAIAETSWPTYGAYHIPSEAFSFAFSVGVLGKDRADREADFEAATDGLSDLSPGSARLQALAQDAWWAANRSFATSAPAEPSVASFLTALEFFALRNEEEAARFRAVVNLIKSVLADERRAAERRSAVHDVVELGATTILVANHAARIQLSDMALDGVRLLSPSDAWRARVSGPLAVIGVVGGATLDAALAARPTELSLIVDPYEARVAASLLRKWDSFLKNIGSEVPVLARLAHALHVVAALEQGEPSVGLDVVRVRDEREYGDQPSPTVSADPAVRIRFVDGSELVCYASRRFDVVSDSGRTVVPKSAGDLARGDEVIVAASNDARAFSERLIELLDGGPLLEDVARRKELLALVRASAANLRVGPARIANLLAIRGVLVSEQAVRGWVSVALDDATVPKTRRALMELFSVLCIELTPDEIAIYWNSARRVRVAHRVAGRKAVAAIRAAAAGRLGRSALTRIEREYGWDARSLVEAAEALIVDEVEEL